jgi:catechol 2,3-dioxygenase-like lactoylglutathione lyase family enzyme
MTIKQMDNVLIVVDDLETAKAFFIELGLKLEGETTVEGPLVGSLIGLKDVRAWAFTDVVAVLVPRPVGVPAHSPMYRHWSF